MTPTEFIQQMKSRGAIIFPPADAGAIVRANENMQQIRAATLPPFIRELYEHVGAINLGSGYIFGPNDIDRGQLAAIPSISRINMELSTIDALRGRTIFGRNDLFWFAFDSFGVCHILDNITLANLRTYDDPYRALTDCLIAGKF